MGFADRQLDRGRLQRKPIGGRRALYKPAQLGPPVLEQCAFVVGDGRRSSEHGIFDEEEDEAAMLSRREQGRIAQREK